MIRLRSRCWLDYVLSNGIVFLDAILQDAHADIEYHKVKINGVPMQSFSSSGSPYDAEDVMHELAEQCTA